MRCRPKDIKILSARDCTDGKVATLYKNINK